MTGVFRPLFVSSRKRRSDRSLRALRPFTMSAPPRERTRTPVYVNILVNIRQGESRSGAGLGGIVHGRGKIFVGIEVTTERWPTGAGLQRADTDGLKTLCYVSTLAWFLPSLPGSCPVLNLAPGPYLLLQQYMQTARQSSGSGRPPYLLTIQRRVGANVLHTTLGAVEKVNAS